MRITRKCMRAAAGLLLLAGGANADIIPVYPAGQIPTTLSPGVFEFRYNTTVTLSQRADSGDFFTIYDFVGFLGGHTEPAGWVFSTLNSGPIPPGTVPPDDPGIPNLTWTWTGASIVGEQEAGVFAATSDRNLLGTTAYTGRGTLSSGPLIGTKVSNVGFTTAPLVPEPGMLGLAGFGVLALRRRR